MKKYLLILFSFISLTSYGQDSTTVCVKVPTPACAPVYVHDTIEVVKDSKGIIEVYILAGQSNALGYNQGTVSVPDSLNGPLEGCLIYNVSTDSIETLQYGVNNQAYSASPAKHGIELAFMQKRYQITGDTAVMIKYAVSGSYIYKMPTLQDWNVGSTKELYWKLRQNINAGLGWVHQMGYTPRITLIWMQGEQDSDSLNKATDHAKNTLNLFNRIKSDIPECEDMQVIIVKTRNISATNSVYDVNVRTGQVQLGIDYPSWIQVVSGDDIDTTNNVHYTSNGIS